MKMKKLILASAVLSLGSVAAQAQTTTEQLQQALAQAQAAAAQAMAAAKQAQAALEQALAAAAQAKTSSQTAASGQMATSSGTGTGLTITAGPNSATLYGLIDVTYVNRNNANAAGQSATAPRVSWFSGNRWGITGARKLGGHDDLKAIFRLESEFENQTGNMDTPGVLFNRDAWLGLESKSLGKLTFGRQNSLARDPAASATYGDPYGSPKASVEEGGYTNNNNFKQLIFYAGSATGTRMDNGVVWKKDFGNIVAGAAYQFGGVTGNFGTGSTKTGSLAYNGNGFTVAGFATSANIANLTHTTFSVGGNVALGSMVRLYGGYFNYKAQQPGLLGDRKDTAWTLSTKIAPNQTYDFELGYQSMRATNAGVSGGFVQNAYSNTSAITTTATGNRNTLYGSAFYHLDAATEFYIAADKLNTTGNYLAAQAAGARSQTELGIGMRYKF